MTKSQEKMLNNFITEFKNTHLISSTDEVKEVIQGETTEFVTLIITIGTKGSFINDQTSRIMISKRGKITGFNSKGHKLTGIVDNLFQ